MAFDWRTAGSEELLAHLPVMDLPAFEAALENEAFTEDHVRLLLKNTGLPADFVERVSREPRFFQRSAIRVALVLHPKLPRVRGLELLHHLFWRDLLRVASQPRVHPQVRAVAEALVAERLPDLTLGERVTAARAAGRGVIRVLRKDPDPRVAEALLRNYRMTEEDALFMASSQDTVPAVLGVLARDPKWRVRPSVKAQLVRNRRLALPLALGLLSELGLHELQAVARQGDLPKVLRESASRLVRSHARGERTGASRR